MSKKPGKKLEGENGIWLLAPRKFILEVNVRGHGRKRETFEGTLHEARNRLSELKKAVKEKPKDDGSLKFMAVKDVLNYYWDEHFKFSARGNNCKKYVESMKTDFGDVPIQDFTIEQFESWLRKRENMKTRNDRLPRPETINLLICTAKSAFNFCVERKKIERNPLALIKKRAPKNIQRRVLGLAEVVALFQEMPAYLRPVFEFMFKVPCRRGEVVSLRNPEDINLKEGVMYLRDEESKTEKGRLLVLPESMMEYFSNIPKESKWVFYRPETTPEGKTIYHQLEGNTLYESVARAATRLEMGKVTVHMFRRTAAVNMLRNGVDIKTVQVAGGWSNLVVLADRYLPIVDGDIKKAVSKIDVPIGPLALSA